MRQAPLTLSELTVVAKVFLLKALAPLGLLRERVGVHLVQRTVEVVLGEVEVVAPVLREVVERLLEVAPAVEHVGLEQCLGIERGAAQALMARALVAERDQLARVALVTAWTVAVAGGVAVQRGLTRVARDQLVEVLAAARTTQAIQENLVNRLFPVDLHLPAPLRTLIVRGG